MKRLFDKFLWKSLEYAFTVSWIIFGDLPVTWWLKYQRNMAFIRFNLPSRKEDK